MAESGHVVTERHCAVASVPMGRKVEVDVKKFELTTTTKVMNSEKLKELKVGREWFNKENVGGDGLC